MYQVCFEPLFLSIQFFMFHQMFIINILTGFPHFISILENSVQCACLFANLCLQSVRSIIIYMEGMSRMDKKSMKPTFCSQKSPKMDFSLSRTTLTPFLEDLAKRPTFHSPRSNNLSTINQHKKYQNEPDTCSQNQTSKRAHSVRGATTFKSSLGQSTPRNKVQQNFSQNLLQLKLQEMTFKVKTKIAALLKPIDIPIDQFSKFTSLTRIDDILEFLYEHLRKKVFSSQSSKSQNINVFSKQRQLQDQYQQKNQLLKKKLSEKEGLEKSYKEKLRLNHREIRELYDKLNQKQRQLSHKATEIYQLKSMSQQTDKMLENYRQKCSSLQKELKQRTERYAAEVKKLIANCKSDEQQLQQLRYSIGELNSIVARQKQKEGKILELNQLLGQQLTRWKERCSSKIDEPAKNNRQMYSLNILKSQEDLQPTKVDLLHEKFSILMLQNQVQSLKYKIKDLQKENRHLSQQITDQQNTKQKYKELLTCTGNNQVISNHKYTQTSLIFNEKWKQMLGQRHLYELTCFHKRKLEEVAKQWRDKLIQLISQNQEVEANLKKEIRKLQKYNQELKIQIHKLANQQYLTAHQFIEKDRELSQIIKKKQIPSKKKPHKTNQRCEPLKRRSQGETSHQSSEVESIDQGRTDLY